MYSLTELICITKRAVKIRQMCTGAGIPAMLALKIFSLLLLLLLL